jgi:multiple sugar transport system permease protein
MEMSRRSWGHRERRPSSQLGGRALAEPIGSRARRLLPIYGLLLPGLLLFFVWAVYPIARSFVMSFTDWRLMGESTFVGLDNYARALQDPAFHRALLTTVGYTVVTVVGQLVLGLAAALLLNESIRGRAVFRLVYYLPVISSWVIVSLIFVWLYNGQTGVLNWLLNDVLGAIDKNVAWLAEPSTALWAIAVLGIWKGVGWTMVVYLAGLQTVPDELHEAAAMDGAGTWARFRDVTLPFLRGTTTFLLVVLTIGGFSTFIPIYVMSSSATGVIGGPLNSTEVALTYTWKQAFGGGFDFAYAAALSFIVAAVVALISVVEFRLAREQGRP